MRLKALVGSGERIGLLTFPFLAIGSVLNVLRPSLFSVGGPSTALTALSAVVLAAGIANWIWSAVLILTRVPKRRLITSGPYSLVKHPLYTGMAFLVFPWAGFLLNTWLGVLIGLVLYVGSRAYSPGEERTLSKAFGASWDEYCSRVKLPWL